MQEWRYGYRGWYQFVRLLQMSESIFAQYAFNTHIIRIISVIRI